MSNDLSTNTPAVKKRYRSICRDPRHNPFRGNTGPGRTQIVDVDEAIPFSQVEEWAREAAKAAGLEFVELEVVK